MGKTPGSDKGNIVHFCGTCGSQIKKGLPDGSLDKIYAGAIPTLAWKPQHHFFCKLAVVDVDNVFGGDNKKWFDFPGSFGGSDKELKTTVEESSLYGNLDKK